MSNEIDELREENKRLREERDTAWARARQSWGEEVIQLRETLEEARIYVDLTYRLSSDRFVQMRSSACVDRIDAALAGKAGQ